MVNKVRGVGLVLAVLLLTGCTNVQKGSAIGATAGGAVGGTVGYLSALGAIEGGGVGMALGAVGGAVAADYYYGDQAEVVDRSGEVSELTTKLTASDQQLAQMRAELEQEHIRSAALVEALEGSQGESPAALTAAAETDEASEFGDDIAVSAEGDAIKLTILSEVLFGSGKAGLSKDGKALLSRAAQTIRANYPDAVIEVRGHTDNVPIRYSKYKSNWELSCARALSVLHHLIEAESFSADKLMASGLADTRPLAPNAAATGRRKNRRAEIIIRPRDFHVAAAR